MLLLRDIAHSRAGDKGNTSNISVVVYSMEDFERIERHVSVERVRAHFTGIVHGAIERYVLPQLGALNFVLHDALCGGVTRSLTLDPHGKSLSSAMLLLEIPDEL